MIQQGHFLPGGVRLGEDSGVNETYRGYIEVGAERIPAYVKLVDSRQFANELAASILGHLAGLKLPRSFVVLVQQTDYPHSQVVQQAGSDIVAFASEAVGRGSGRRLRLDMVALAAFLHDWKEWPEAAAFDEWIANADRHPGNVMIGQRGEVWLIDHSHAFMGSNWTAAHLNPTAVIPNQLCDAACGCISLTDKLNAYAAALQASTKFARIDIIAALGHVYLRETLDANDHAALTSFLAARTALVDNNISVRLGLPGLKFGATV